MPPKPDPAQPARSVLARIADRTGLASKVLLPDAGSEHGASPVLDPSAPSARLVPQGRGNYQLLGEIARGGMGVILKGHDTDLGRDVALKVLDEDLAKSPAVVQRFVEEAQIGGQLQHPGIVPVYELGLMADDRPYFTMKLVKGRTLAAILTARKSPAEERGRLLGIFESVCQTMAYAHSKGVLHRDLKPANIMVGAFGEVQVVDWGLAKVLHRGGVADERRAKETLHTVIETIRSGPGSSGSDSLVGSVMGTPAYMAPEQAQGEVEKLDERADVFSLGAILCEILTGRPPYEERPDVPVVMQAARAELDPARARLDAAATSGADPAIVRLCLDCLTPAKAARPANAEQVAKAVHAYLTSTEERAQKAELDAAEARIKAAEERRARRLTLALAGTVFGALALGAGGFAWVRHEREQRTEQVRRSVEEAHGEAIEHGRAGRPDEALASARRALALAESGGADADLVERARGFVAQAERDVGAAERERALREQDERLRDRLIDLRVGQIATLGSRQREAELDAAFAQTFRDYGVDLEGADLVPALARIRERAIAEEVALALDDWGRVRRKVHGSRSEKAENLFYLAMDLDADPERVRMRQAIASNDLATMLELASPERLPNLGPGSIFVLSAALWDGYPQHRADVYRMYDQAVRLYPGDYPLQAVGGNIYQEAGRFEASLACRTAALSLRPHDPTARMRAIDALYFLGRMTEAEGACRALLASHPEHVEAHLMLGLCRLQLGDYEEAHAELERGFAIAARPDYAPDRLAVRYCTGTATREELSTAIASATTHAALATYLHALLDHPDPAKRDPRYVLRVLEEQRGLAGADCEWVVAAVAKVRVEDWQGALAAIEGHYSAPSVLIVTPGAFEFLRTLVLAKLGRADAARECYARAIVGWKELTGGNETAWERSDVMRWRREAEAALAR